MGGVEEWRRGFWWWWRWRCKDGGWCRGGVVVVVDDELGSFGVGALRRGYGGLGVFLGGAGVRKL